MRKQLVSGKKLLLFVDTGDNCRCPLAIGYLTKLLQQKNIDYIDLRHMGVMTPNDLLPTPEVVQLLKEEGVDIRYHRSRPVNDDLIRQADLVIGFTAIHVQTCLRRVPECKPKTFLLKEYVGLAHTGDQIHDPMGSTMEIFKKYFTEIKQSLQKLVEMDFIALPPEPKEVVILPTVTKPRMAEDDEEELPAGYYDEEELTIKREKAAKAKKLLKAQEEAELAAEAEMERKAKAAKTAASEKPAKKAASKPAAVKKAAPAEKPAKAAVKPAADKKEPSEKKTAVAEKKSIAKKASAPEKETAEKTKVKAKSADKDGAKSAKKSAEKPEAKTKAKAAPAKKTRK